MPDKISAAPPANGKPEKQNDGVAPIVYKPPESLISLWWLLTGILVLIVYGMQLRVMQGQLSVMEYGQRPWIGFQENGIRSDPLTINSTGWVSTSVSTTTKNFGNGPAFMHDSVFANLVVVDIEHGADIIASKLKDQLSSQVPRGIGPTFTVFPGGASRSTNSTSEVCTLRKAPSLRGIILLQGNFMTDKESERPNQPNTPNDKSQSQTQDQKASVAPTPLPARNPQMAFDHALPERNPDVGLKTQKDRMKKQED
ncbi:MAG: hypothetical protein ABSD64_02790 [Terriglobales bacterium]|jgi:hypothetical protein